MTNYAEINRFMKQHSSDISKLLLKWKILNFLVVFFNGDMEATKAKPTKTLVFCGFVCYNGRNVLLLDCNCR